MYLWARLAFECSLSINFHHSNQQQKSTKRQKTNVDLPHSEDIGHILGIVSSLLTNLASDSTHRIRLLTKFVEGNYEKVDKLLEIREGARKRLRNIEEELELEKQVRLVIPWLIPNFKIAQCSRTL